MAGFLELIDNTLGTHFNAPVYNPEKGRAKMFKAIDAAERQYSEGKIRVPNRAWTVGTNQAISYSPKLNGHAIRIGKEETNYVPEERFTEFLKGFKAAVNKGDFDDQIEAAMTAEPGQATGGASRSSVRGRSGPRQSSLPARADGISHRVPANEEQPHPDYVMNKGKTYWRSPEQVHADEEMSAKRKATQAANAKA